MMLKYSKKEKGKRYHVSFFCIFKPLINIFKYIYTREPIKTNNTNMNHRYLKIGYLSAAVCFTLTACASTHDDDEFSVVPQDPTEVPTTTQYGMERQSVLDYFSNALKGATGEYGESVALPKEDIEAAKKYVWDIWATSVRRASGERLPTLSSHYKLDDWGDVTTPDANWKVPEGTMSIFYGSKGESPAAGYPLFLYLHGSGDDANNEWTTNLSWAQYYNDGPSAYFVPKSPQGGTGVRWFQPSKQEKWEQMLRQALSSGKIDPNKVYFMGISEGAYGSQRLASFYADYLAGAGPIAGGEFLKNCPPENLANIAFTLQTGALDESYGRALLTGKVNSELNDLEAAHPGYYVHNVELQAGKGHSCDYTKTTPWLVNYTRNATPKYVYWENFGMGDINGEPRRYRETFYNLQIVEPSDDRSDDMRRTAYEMTINGNTIDLTVNNVTLTETEPASLSTGTVNIGVAKAKTPATYGKIRVWLDNALVDLSQPVVVKVNGVEKFNGLVEPSTGDLVESCSLFYDPQRVFPASVEVSVN